MIGELPQTDPTGRKAGGLLGTDPGRLIPGTDLPIPNPGRFASRFVDAVIGSAGRRALVVADGLFGPLGWKSVVLAGVSLAAVVGAGVMVHRRVRK